QVYDAVPAAEQAEEEHVYDAVPAAAAREEAAAVEPEVAPAENAYDLHHAAAPALAPAPGAAAAAPAITPAGPGVSHASPELLAEQAQLRALAAEVKTAGWQAVDPAQARWGWAITGMHQHGVDFDTKLAKDTVKYHSDTERGEHLLALRDGKLAYAHGDKELKSDLTAENARARMPRLFMEHMKEQFVALLEGKGLKSEATQVRGLDAAIGARAIAMFGKLGGADKAMVDGFARAADEKVAASGRLIFAMNQSGQIFAGNGFATIVHHSTFLAGGPVACAGELAVSGGAIKAISNNSGHYRPGPAHLWQAVRQLAMDGVDVAGVDVEVQLAGTLKGADFLANLSPLRPKDDPGFLSFDPVTGAAAVRRYLTGA
ncbi:MAG: hypothetical protein KC635_24695, partial [Myxococcales bacterium]|nr:hypothetical protein [Myxococcales bacterium]